MSQISGIILSRFLQEDGEETTAMTELGQSENTFTHRYPTSKSVWMTSRACDLDRAQARLSTPAPKAPSIPRLIVSIIVPLVAWTSLGRGVMTSSAAEGALGLPGTHHPNTNIFPKSSLLGPIYSPPSLPSLGLWGTTVPHTSPTRGRGSAPSTSSLW